MQRSPASNAPGVCNGHLPTNSIYTRFLWVIRFLVRNHFYVVLDNQLNIDSTALDDPVRWVGLWEQLLADVVADPVSKARVMVDILNEPDSRDLQCAPYSKAQNPRARILVHSLFESTPVRPALRPACCALVHLKRAMGDIDEPNSRDLQCVPPWESANPQECVLFCIVNERPAERS